MFEIGSIVLDEYTAKWEPKAEGDTAHIDCPASTQAVEYYIIGACLRQSFK